MKYLVSQEIKSETKIGKNVYIFDLFFMIVYCSVSLVLANAVHSALKVPFLIFSLGIAFCLTLKSYNNKRRRNYESIFIFLRRDEDVYKPVLNISKKTDTTDIYESEGTMK